MGTIDSSSILDSTISSSTVQPYDRLYSKQLSSNLSAFLGPEYITIEYTNDGGST